MEHFVRKFSELCPNGSNLVPSRIPTASEHFCSHFTSEHFGHTSEHFYMTCTHVHAPSTSTSTSACSCPCTCTCTCACACSMHGIEHHLHGTLAGSRVATRTCNGSAVGSDHGLFKVIATWSSHTGRSMAMYVSGLRCAAALCGCASSCAYERP